MAGPQPTPRIASRDRPAAQPFMSRSFREPTGKPAGRNSRPREPHRSPSVAERAGDVTGWHRQTGQVDHLKSGSEQTNLAQLQHRLLPQPSGTDPD